MATFVLVTGASLVLMDSTWNFGQLRVLLALGAFAVAFLIGAVYPSRSAIPGRYGGWLDGSRT
jgi:hypothetical protein